MCGRYVATTDADELAEWFGAVAPEVAPPVNHNVAPTSDVLAVVEGAPETVAAGERLLEHFRWGLVPSWAKDLKIGNRMINARAETVATSNAFRSSYRSRRCLVAADAFYEWRKDPADPKRKQPYLIRRADGQPLAFGGLWSRWRDKSLEDPPVVHSATIVTTTPNRMMALVHDRMPVIVDAADWDRWLDPTLTDGEAVADLLRPAPDDLLVAHAVDPAVGNVRNRGEELVEPVEPADGFPATITVADASA